MRKLLLFLMLLLPLAGCLQVEQHFTINPDGSGKVAIESFVTDWTLDASDRNIRKKIREMARDVIDSTHGVDAWRDVRYSFDKGRFRFRGTAYFRDISKLKGNRIGLTNFDWSRGGDGSARVGLTEFKSDAGSLTPDGGGALGDSMSIEQQVDSMRTSIEMMKGMMGSFLSDFRVQTELTLPGPPVGVSGFTRNAKGNLQFALTGDMLLGMLDTMLNNRELIRSQIVSPPDSSSIAARNLLFPNGMPTATIPAGAKPLFNYSTEVAAARREHAKIVRDLAK